MMYSLSMVSGIFAGYLTATVGIASSYSTRSPVAEEQMEWLSTYPAEEEVITRAAYYLIQLKITFDHYVSLNNQKLSAPLAEIIILMIGACPFAGFNEYLGFLLAQTDTRTNTRKIIALADYFAALPLERISKILEASPLEDPYYTHLKNQQQRLGQATLNLRREEKIANESPRD